MHAIDTVAIGRPITRGPITLYPLYTPGRPAVPDYVPGPLAARRGILPIDEVDGGRVPTIEITNTGDAPVLLVEGETFAGGLQNRTLNVSVLVDRGATRVPVSCVEAHRWSDPRPMELSDRRAPRRLRRTKDPQRAVRHEPRRLAPLRPVRGLAGRRRDARRPARRERHRRAGLRLRRPRRVDAQERSGTRLDRGRGRGPRGAGTDRRADRCRGRGGRALHRGRPVRQHRDARGLLAPDRHEPRVRPAVEDG